MSFEALHHLLQDMFAELNAANAVASPTQIWDKYNPQILPLLTASQTRNEFTSLGNAVWLPQSIEAARILSLLRQRFNPSEQGRPLVGRVRAEVVLKERPVRNQPRDALTDEAQGIAACTPTSFSAYSDFQVDGWGKVLQAIRERSGLVVVAPTGTGKTEVFLLPLIYEIAQTLPKKRADVPRFVLLYPRVTLLKDQLPRIFRYVHLAEQRYLSQQDTLWGDASAIKRGITIGLQFGGISPNAQDLFDNREVFEEDRTFRLVEQCPICSRGKLRAKPHQESHKVILACDQMNCGATFRTSLTRSDHVETQPHLLITTAESLDRLYLDARFERYLTNLTGIMFDEVHIYHSLYGVHIHNLVRRIEELRSDKRPLAKIAASATISHPEQFAAKLFYGDEHKPVVVHDTTGYDRVPAGLEILYFLQSPEEENRPGAAPTLIQTAMAMGHGVLKGTDRALVFTESIDLAGRLENQIHNAETERWNEKSRRNAGLWEFRTVLNSISFRNQGCPHTSPLECSHLYWEGECWRGVIGGQQCCQPIKTLREQALKVVQVSSQQKTRYSEGDIVVATPALEVGVDDERIKTTIHYLPPRTVFSFIQRRGRAGRVAGETSYTLMVLGNTPSDHFYFFRRHRLVRGTYELPLNPQNRLVRAMHDLLQQQRERMHQHIQREGHIPEGIWRWVWETLEDCSLITHYYGQKLHAQSAEPVLEQKRFIKDWIAGERDTLGNYLSLLWLLREVEEEATKDFSDLIDLVHEAIAAVNNFLSNQGATSEDVRQLLGRLYTELGKLHFGPEPDPDLDERLATVEKKIRDAWAALSRQQNRGIELRHAQALYDFFRTLERLFAHRTILFSAPDTLKITLQAMFYLHLGLDEEDESELCPSRVGYFIPDAYFQVLRPIVIEVHYRDETRRDLKQEDVTSLATTLIPYKTIYRYHLAPFLSILDTEHNPDWVSDDRKTVKIRLQAEGVKRGGVLIPQRVSVKPIASDNQGQQLVRICPECFAIYGLNRKQCKCGKDLRAAKIYADPIVERDYDEEAASRPISNTLRFCERLQGNTTVYGSSVEGRYMYWEAEEKTWKTSRGRLDFEARYDLPLRYGLSTKGIIWSLRGVVERLLQDESLREQVGRILAQNSPKKLSKQLILHTAAHLLHRAIASLSGVNEQQLEYCVNLEKEEVVVWERYEGGGGISEIFVDSLRTDAVEIYQALLSSVLCPVDLAERQDWTSSDDLRTALAEQWRLSPDDEFITHLVQEAEAERQVQRQREDEETRLVCRPPEGPDGCPACIHTTYCTERYEQPLAVSRLVGEAILRCLIQQVTRSEAEELVRGAIVQDLAPPTMLTADLGQGIYNVLIL